MHFNRLVAETAGEGQAGILAQMGFNMLVQTNPHRTFLIH